MDNAYQAISSSKIPHDRNIWAFACRALLVFSLVVGLTVVLAPTASAVEPSPDENEDNEPDPKARPRMLQKFDERGFAGATHIKDHPKAQQMLNGIVQGLMRKEINVSLLGGEKYMVNKCLGIKASAGEFNLKLANPKVGFEGTGVTTTFAIDRISMNGLSVRIRPNVTNPLKLCKFSKRRSVGGAAKNVRLELKFDPLLDVRQCKVGNIGKIHAKVRIGGLNLKPLQNNLDEVAKNMLEDSLTYVFENMWSGAGTDQVIRTINDVLELDCPAKKGRIN